MGRGEECVVVCENSENSERLKPKDSRDEPINSLSGSYGSSHVMNERLEKPEDSTNSVN